MDLTKAYQTRLSGLMFTGPYPGGNPPDPRWSIPRATLSNPIFLPLVVEVVTYYSHRYGDLNL